MKFDDAIQIIDGMPTASGSFGVSPDVVKKIVEDLREEYEPKIYLKKSDKEMLLYYLENANFPSLLESILSSKASTLFGVRSIENIPFYGLSEEDIMYAWVNPNSIQIIDEE